MINDVQIFSWGHKRRFNDFSNHFKNQFSERVQKVSIDAGFTCPNRNGTIGIGGCTFCNNKTFKPTYCTCDSAVYEQVERGIGFFEKKYKSMLFLAYFQAYTNTNAPLQQLINLYEEALSHPKIVGLVVATRPDCLPANVLDYLEKKSKQCYIMVEIGVESANDETLKFINRGHNFEIAQKAIFELHARNIHNCVHMILGLPYDTRELILEQSKIISNLPVENLKLHQLQIHKGTVMEKQFVTNPEFFNLFDTVDDYIEIVIDYIELLNPEIIIERFVSQSPKELLVAPKWGLKNFEFVAKLEKRLIERNTWQGRLFS